MQSFFSEVEKLSVRLSPLLKKDLMASAFSSEAGTASDR